MDFVPYEMRIINALPSIAAAAFLAADALNDLAKASHRVSDEYSKAFKAKRGE